MGIALIVIGHWAAAQGSGGMAADMAGDRDRTRPIHHTTWRVERVTNPWQLSRYCPGTETWQRVWSYPSRADAIQAAYESPPRSGC
jgi:hypothetical protein